MPDREKVIKGLNHCFHGQECCGDTECPYYIELFSDACLEYCQEDLKADVLSLLKEQEIVRCKDCKHYGENECMIKAGWFPVQPDWFCADGERKEE